MLLHERYAPADDSEIIWSKRKANTLVQTVDEIRLGVRPPSIILVYGAPGTGKLTTIRALFSRPSPRLVDPSGRKKADDVQNDGQSQRPRGKRSAVKSSNTTSGTSARGRNRSSNQASQKQDVSSEAELLSSLSLSEGDSGGARDVPTRFALSMSSPPTSPDSSLSGALSTSGPTPPPPPPRFSVTRTATNTVSLHWDTSIDDSTKPTSASSVAQPVPFAQLPCEVLVRHSTECTPEELYNFAVEAFIGGTADQTEETRLWSSSPAAAMRRDSASNVVQSVTIRVLKLYGEAGTDPRLNSALVRCASLMSRLRKSSALRQQIIIVVHTSHDVHNEKYGLTQTLPVSFVESPAVLSFHVPPVTERQLQGRLKTILKRESDRIGHSIRLDGGDEELEAICANANGDVRQAVLQLQWATLLSYSDAYRKGPGGKSADDFSSDLCVESKLRACSVENVPSGCKRSRIGSSKEEVTGGNVKKRKRGDAGRSVFAAMIDDDDDDDDDSIDDDTVTMKSKFNPRNEVCKTGAQEIKKDKDTKFGVDGPSDSHATSKPGNSKNIAEVIDIDEFDDDDDDDDSKDVHDASRPATSASSGLIVKGAAGTTLTVDAPLAGVKEEGVDERSGSRAGKRTCDEYLDVSHASARILTQKYAIEQVMPQVNAPPAKLLGYLTTSMPMYFHSNQIVEYAACADAVSLADSYIFANTSLPLAWRQSARPVVGRITGGGSGNVSDFSDLLGAESQSTAQVSGGAAAVVGTATGISSSVRAVPLDFLGVFLFGAAYNVYQKRVVAQRGFLAQHPPPYLPFAFPRLSNVPQSMLRRHQQQQQGRLADYGQKQNSGLKNRPQSVNSFRDDDDAHIGDVVKELTEQDWEREALSRLSRQSSSGSQVTLKANQLRRSSYDPNTPMTPHLPTSDVDLLRLGLPSSYVEKTGTTSAVVLDYAPLARIIALSSPASSQMSANTHQQHQNQLQARKVTNQFASGGALFLPMSQSSKANAPIKTGGAKRTILSFFTQGNTAKPSNTTDASSPSSSSAPTAASLSSLPPPPPVKPRVTPLQLALLKCGMPADAQLRNERFDLSTSATSSTRTGGTNNNDSSRGTDAYASSASIDAQNGEKRLIPVGDTIEDFSDDDDNDHDLY